MFSDHMLADIWQYWEVIVNLSLVHVQDKIMLIELLIFWVVNNELVVASRKVLAVYEQAATWLFEKFLRRIDGKDIGELIIWYFIADNMIPSLKVIFDLIKIAFICCFKNSTDSFLKNLLVMVILHQRNFLRYTKCSK